MNTERITTFLTLTLILIMSGALLCVRISAPYDGYLAFNEAWYSTITQNFDTHSWFEPTPADGQTDLRVPPFFSFVLYFFYLVFGVHEWAFRMLPIACGLMSVFLVHLIGRTIYDFRAGLCAAALMAFSPVFILTSHNVQTDSMFLMCILAGLFFLLCYRINDNPGTLIFSAIMYGCGLFTKQFAIVAIAAFILAEIAQQRSRAPGSGFDLKKAIIVAFIIIVLPGQYYLYHLIVHPALLFSHSRYGAVTTAEIPGLHGLVTLFAEMFFGLGPAVAVVGAAALVKAALKRKAPELHILFPLALFTLFFILMHKHTYYMLAILPFLCLIAGQFIASLRWKSIGVIITVVSIAAGLLQSMMVMGALKYGYARFNAACAFLDSNDARKTLIVDHNVMSRFGPAVQYYCSGSDIIDKNVFVSNTPPGPVKAPGDAKFFFIDYAGEQTGASSPYQKVFYRSVFGPVIFGRFFYYIPYEREGRMRTFVPGRVHIESAPARIMPIYFKQTALKPSITVTKLPPGYAVYRNSNEAINAGGPQIQFRKIEEKLPAHINEINKQR